MRFTASVTEERRKQEAAALFGLAVFGWAFPGTLVRLMPHLPPMPLVGLRLSVAFLCLLPFMAVAKTRAAMVFAFKSWRCWVLSLGMLLYYTCATPAFLYAPVGEVALIIASAPLFAVILRGVARQPVTKFELIGAVLAVIGVVIMASPSMGHHSGAIGPEWVGVLLAITAAMAAAGYAIGNRHLANLGKSPGAIPQVGLTFLLGLLLLPTLVMVPAGTIGQAKMLWLIPLGALSTALPTVAVAASSHRISAIAVTMINPLTSVCASVVAAAVIHEAPKLWTVVGGALILAAVFIAAREPKKA
jgi:drug/metabolite transporter (DMT)-like permease